MTSEPVNLLIAVLCLLSLILAGGFTQSLVPADAQVRFEIQPVPLDCTPIPGSDRVVWMCAGYNSSGDDRGVASSGWIPQGLPVVNRSTGSSSASDSTPGTSAGAHSSTGATTDSSETEGEPATGGMGEPTDPPNGPPPTNTSRGSGFDLGSGFERLLWPSVVLLVGVVAIGGALGLRSHPLGSPRDLLTVPTIAFDTLLSLLVRFGTSLAGVFRDSWNDVVTAVTGVSARGLEPPRYARAERGLPLRRLLLGLLALPVELIARRWEADDANGATTPGRDGDVERRSPSLRGDDFDIEGAWAWLAVRTSGSMPVSRTPDDIARDAIERGYPREAVRDLLRVFRDVTYGGRTPTDDRRQVARQAYETLRAADRSTGGGGE